jgi:hypothetical protein
MLNKSPIPLIQNHNSWCWAVCARLLGEHYAERRLTTVLELTSLEYSYPFGMPIDDLNGFREEYLGCADGNLTADLWQWTIVHASGAGQTGTATDDVKERAVKFVITGNPESTLVDVNTYGKLTSGVSVYPFFRDTLCSCKDDDLCFIGNCFLLESAAFHSVFVKGNMNVLHVYDPWNGDTLAVSAERLFERGISLPLGTGAVKWIQYIL